MYGSSRVYHELRTVGRVGEVNCVARLLRQPGIVAKQARLSGVLHGPTRCAGAGASRPGMARRYPYIPTREGCLKFSGRCPQLATR